MHKNLLIQVDR